MNDVPDVEIPNTEQIPDSQNNQSEHEISQNYEGAPEMVKKNFHIFFEIFFYFFKKTSNSIRELIPFFGSVTF